jgi:uncharacterized protein
MKLFLSVILLFLCSTIKAQDKKTVLKTNENGNTLLWEISGNRLKKPSYVFGTFHLMCKVDITESNALKFALQDCKTLYLELDLDDPKTLMGGMSLLNMKKGKKLKDLFTYTEFVRINNFYKDSLNIAIDKMPTVKPMFLMSMMFPKMLPCKLSSGVEEGLMKLAKQNKQPIEGLESIEFQASVFDSISYEAQAKELLKTIDSFEISKKELDGLISIYKNQQLDKIQNSFSKSEFGVQGNEDILLTNRNINWVGQLKKIMKTNNIFVAVGAAHLVGKQGLIALLKKAGYKLRPIKN